MEKECENFVLRNIRNDIPISERTIKKYDEDEFKECLYNAFVDGELSIYLEWYDKTYPKTQSEPYSESYSRYKKIEPKHDIKSDYSDTIKVYGYDSDFVFISGEGLTTHPKITEKIKKMGGKYRYGIRVLGMYYSGYLLDRDDFGDLKEEYPNLIGNILVLKDKELVPPFITKSRSGKSDIIVGDVRGDFKKEMIKHGFKFNGVLYYKGMPTEGFFIPERKREEAEKILDKYI